MESVSGFVTVYRSWLLPTCFMAAFVAGSGLLAPLWLRLYNLWVSDPLRGIGMWFPLVSCLGVAAAWRRSGWELRGSAWGLAVILASVLLTTLGQLHFPTVSMGAIMLSLLPSGVLVFLYGVGALLLLGGKRVVRACLAPLCLLLFVNPLPGIYNVWVDMPLQQVSAATARAFAHLIGLQPTGEDLRMMFAPDFGMMIVPGCDGVRGSVTLAYLTLIFGYAMGLRRTRLAVATGAAAVAGLLLNLLRLCVLVVYYKIGVLLPSIRGSGTAVDYVIGGTIFLLATVLLGVLILRMARQCPVVETPAKRPVWSAQQQTRTLTWSALLALCAIASVTLQAPSLAQARRSGVTGTAALGLLPTRVGDYHLVASRTEESNGRIKLVLGDYARGDVAGDGHRMTLGLWLAGPEHLVYFSKRIKGERPQWTGSFSGTTANGQRAQFYSTLFTQGHVWQFNAETICTSAECSIQMSGGANLQIGVAPGNLKDAFGSPAKRMPILLRSEETVHPGQEAMMAKAFQRDAKSFFHDLDLLPLIQAAGSQL